MKLPVNILVVAVINMITLIVILIIVADYHISLRGAQTTEDISVVPKQHIALILGTSQRGKGGRSNQYFDNRINAAVELWKQSKVDIFVVSGDNGQVGYDEPTDMKFALMQKGVPEKAVYCDYAGFRTLDSVIRVKEIFGQNQAIVVSQRFHNERAIFIGEKYGINLFGFNAKDVGSYYGFKTKLREQLARFVCLLDVGVLHTKPRFLGKKINI